MDLIDFYKNGIHVVGTYRRNLIKNIRSHFTIDEFYKKEKELEDKYWRLCDKIGIGCSEHQVYDLDDLDQVKLKLKGDTYYRSFINKVITVDDQAGKVYYQKMEGSPSIFGGKDQARAMVILLDKKLYDRVMDGDIDPNSVPIPEYYLQQNYGFPNLNYCGRGLGSAEFRKKKIYKMFFCDDCEKNWFRLIT